MWKRLDQGTQQLRANQASQQSENAQVTRVWWRRIAVSERTWKSAQPSSSLICL